MHLLFHSNLPVVKSRQMISQWCTPLERGSIATEVESFFSRLRSPFVHNGGIVDFSIGNNRRRPASSLRLDLLPLDIRAFPIVPL